MVRLAVDVEILPHIGKGSYGNVFKCVDPVTNHPWAVKVMRWGTPRDKERALNEVGIHGMLMRYGCRSVVELHGGGHPMAMVGDDRCCLVQRYHETDLDRIFACTSTSTSDVICERRLACLAYDIVTGIADIHESNVLHRDLKLANILISKSGRVGICDFGLACMAYPSSDQEGDYVVTKRFRPVELLLGAQTHSREVDVWSFGCILLNMLCNGRSPIHGNTEEEILESIVRLFGYYEVA
jgi:serine/threonine protein kinase